VVGKRYRGTDLTFQAYTFGGSEPLPNPTSGDGSLGAPWLSTLPGGPHFSATACRSSSFVRIALSSAHMRRRACRRSLNPHGQTHIEIREAKHPPLRPSVHLVCLGARLLSEITPMLRIGLPRHFLTPLI